jgi:hypothetical protein
MTVKGAPSNRAHLESMPLLGEGAPALAQGALADIVAAWSGEPIEIPLMAWPAILQARAQSQQPLELAELQRIIEADGGHDDHR